MWEELDGAQSWALLIVLYTLVLWLACGFVVACALNLTGWMCRRRFSGLRVLLWLPVWLGVLWGAAALITDAVMSLGFGEGTPWLPVLGGAVVFALISFAALLPFLILSLSHSFYRQRLLQLLRLPLEDTSPPAPVSTPLTEPSQVG
jgi:hypothetical protein